MIEEENISVRINSLHAKKENQHDDENEVYNQYVLFAI
jgi:hypothetical protein